jgi:hypothetical protein
MKWNSTSLCNPKISVQGAVLKRWKEQFFEAKILPLLRLFIALMLL